MFGFGHRSSGRDRLSGFWVVTPVCRSIGRLGAPLVGTVGRVAAPLDRTVVVSPLPFAVCIADCITTFLDRTVGCVIPSLDRIVSCVTVSCWTGGWVPAFQNSRVSWLLLWMGQLVGSLDRRLSVSE